MSQDKKILISIPDSLLQEVDAMVSHEKSSRSRLVSNALTLYIKEKKKTLLRRQMRKGYREMAEINLNLAEICFPADSTEEYCAEEILAECD